MLDLVSTVESLNSTVMTAMNVMSPVSPVVTSLEDQSSSADKIRILQTEIAKLTKTVHELKTLQEETRQNEQINNILRDQNLGMEDAENVLDLSSFIDDAFVTTTPTTTTTTTTTTDFPITTFNWFTSSPSTKRPTTTKTTTNKKPSKFVPSAEGEGFLEITVSGSMGPESKKQEGSNYFGIGFD